MNHSPLVSVIIIFLNAEPFLEEAIASVFEQTTSNWELLLVDDGSTDGSTEIARRYEHEHPGQVKYLEHPDHENRGMSATRNLGIRHARGEFIALLDADDVWLPHKLERQLDMASRHPEADMVCGASEYWWSWTGDEEDAERDWKQPVGAPADTLILPPRLALLLYPLGEGAAPCPCDLLLRREAIERVGGFEESYRGALQMYEDQAFLAKLYLGSPVFVSSECLSRYRQHPDSCVSSVTRSGRYDLVRQHFLQWLEDYLNQRGVDDGEIRLALNRALWPYRHPRLTRLKSRSWDIVGRLYNIGRTLLQSTARWCLPAPARRWIRSRLP